MIAEMVCYLMWIVVIWHVVKFTLKRLESRQK